jgi:enamine deaminase RidA (YjgF/YER057c/UK114 family)
MSSIVNPAARRGPGFSLRRHGPPAGSASTREMSRHRIVNPPELGAPSGFSHAVVAGGRTVHLAGQIGAGESLAEQFDNAATNLLIALRAAGGEPEDLVSLQVFVTDVAAYKASLPALGRAWREHFGRHYPAMGLFGVSELFEPWAQVELMGVAVLPE